MTGRNSRSPAGLQSTSPLSPSSRIEDVLNMHSVPSPSPRAQRVSISPPNYPPARRSLYSPPQLGHASASAEHSDQPVGNGVGGSRSTPILPSAASSRSASRAASSSFVPRVVRGTIAERETSSSAGHSPGPSGRAPLSASSPPRPRRASSAAHRTMSAGSSTNTAVPPPPHAAAFPRPSYLDNSALRHYIQSEPAAGVPPDRYRLDSLHTGASTTSSAHARDVPPSARDTDSDEESSASAGERDRTVPPPRVPQRRPAETVMHLPTRWSDEDRCPSLSVSADGRELTFNGPNQGEKEAAAARANYPIPAACGIYYYEIEILNKGVKGHISIGFGTRSFRLSRLPGWEGQSWGYHGDDGHSFASEREGSTYGPKFTTGDVVGCGIDFSQGQAFFTKNGRYLGPIFDNLSSGGELYPSVGLRTPNEAIRANFGHEPFTFDIDTHVGQMRNRTWARIQSTPITWSVHGDTGTFTVPTEDGKRTVPTAAGSSHVDDGLTEMSNPVNELILAYLAHHGYAKTARAFKTQCDRRSGVDAMVNASVPHTEDHAMAMDTDTGQLVPSTLALPLSNSIPAAQEIGLGAGTGLMQDDTLKRQKIVHSIVDGNIDIALEDTRAHYPTVLDREDGLILFKLRCRKFVELVLDAAAAFRMVREEAAGGKGKDVVSNGVGIPQGESMDVDDDISPSSPVLNGNSKTVIPPQLSKPIKIKPPVASVSPSMATYQMALKNALRNGQSLRADYKSDARATVQAICKRTWSLVAYDDPLADDPPVPEAVKEMAGQGAREQLAEEVNRAILESQGKPPHPVLERLYRQTQACVVQLGWLGVGSAAFADMPKEFLDA